MDKRFDELDKKARWKWGSVVVPLAVSIFPHYHTGCSKDWGWM
jgi:uncharacterized membrane protein YhdT